MFATDDYTQYWFNKEREWEALCIRCGGCCGAYDDPCIYLRKVKDGKYYCLIYDHRFGKRVTVKGEEFECVPIRKIIHQRWRKDYLCVYKKRLKKSFL